MGGMCEMKRKAVRVFAGLLCAAIVFSNAGLRVFAIEEDGTGQEITQESVSENDIGEDDADQPEGAEEPDGSDEAEDSEETDDQEDTEESGEEVEDPEEEADREDSTEEQPEEESDKKEDEIGTEIEKPAEAAEREESAEEGIMLMALQEGPRDAAQADSTYTDAKGVIYYYYGYDDGTAEIYKLENYNESSWDYKALTIPAHIGGYTVTRLTFTVSSDIPWFPSVTIPETVTYMEGSLFKRMKISALYYNAENATTGATSESTGVFFQANIQELHIGENVKTIPDYCFDSAKITMDNLTVNVESIGRQAFYYDKKITTLTIGENVKEIGQEAFAENEIDTIHYNAVNAESKPHGGAAFGTFEHITVSDITIGNQVTVIPEHLFYGIDYTTDTLVLPDCLTTIGAWAFYGNISIGELTIGENVASIGKMAFAVDEIGTLNYNAVEARVEGMTESENYRNPFWGVIVGSLQIGEQVKSLPDSLFYAMGLTQDKLVVPDSVTYIGAYVLSHAGDYNSGKTTKIGTLEIGENVSHIGNAAFGAGTFDKAVVRAVESDIAPKSDTDLYLPLCKAVEIHLGSPYYTYFTKRTGKDNITQLCEDFETSRGEEYYDSGKNSFVTPITKLCNDCGYGESSREYSEAFTVIFTDHDGRELSRQHLHNGEDATAPEEPERTGYQFTGWDKDFTNVTSDLTVKAVYQVRNYSVVFKDYDNTVIAELDLPYGADIYAAKPADPKREPDGQHTYQFSGWQPALAEDAKVTGNAEYTASYVSAEREYSIRFLDYDGSLLSELALPYGSGIYEVKPADPKRAPDERHTFQFNGWEPSLTEDSTVTKNAEYTAVYTSAERLYVLSFVDHTGGTIKTVMEPYGTRIADKAPKNPTREPDGDCTYTFAGWQPALSEDDILTKDTEYQAVFTSSAAKCKVVFQDFDGSVLKELTLKAGETVSGEAPTASREGDSLTTYTFAGWQPALDENAPIMGDITYKALYTRKTQTGVLAEHELNHPAGDGISAEDVRLYPVYEIYDTSDHFKERVTDREHPVDASDIRLSKDRIEKGSNQIGAVQVSTGLRTEFRIFGNYIDGISVELAERKVKTGSRLQDLDVYFTKNRMGEDGQIKSGIVDKTRKVKNYTFADGAAYVIVKKGDNEIRITEKETGENHSCTVHITGEGEEKDAKDEKPTGDDGKPDGETEKEPRPEPETWQIAVTVPEKEVKPVDTRRIALVWDRAGEVTPVLEIADAGAEIVLQEETTAESEETETVLPEIREPEVQEQADAITEEEQTGAETEETEELRTEKLPLWMLPAAFAVFGIAAMAVMLYRRRREKFHGILTWEENSSVEISNPKECLETVQEVIDRTENLADCMKALRESGAKTYLPVSTRMEVAYTDEDGETQVIEDGASEKKMARILSSIHGSERANVRIYQEQAGIDIKLTYKL